MVRTEILQTQKRRVIFKTAHFSAPFFVLKNIIEKSAKTFFESEAIFKMFKHEKMLFHPVEVERPNPQYAALLQEQLGGANGELKAAM